MLAQVLQLQIVRFQKEIRISRRPWQLLPRQFARVRRGVVQLLRRVACLPLRRESLLQFPRECGLQVRRAHEPRLQRDHAHLVQLANATALQRVVVRLLSPSALRRPQPDDAPLPRRDVGPLPPPAGALLRQRCVELLLQRGGELLPRPGDALLLPRDDAQLLRRGVALQSLHAGELLPLRDDGLALPPGDELLLQRGDAQLLRPGIALLVQLSGVLVHAPAPARLPLRWRETWFRRVVAAHLPARACALPIPDSDALLRRVGSLVFLQPAAEKRAVPRAPVAQPGNELRLHADVFLHPLAAPLSLLRRGQFLHLRFVVAVLLRRVHGLPHRSAGVRAQRAGAQFPLPAAAIVPAQPVTRSLPPDAPTQLPRGGPLRRF